MYSKADTNTHLYSAKKCIDKFPLVSISIITLVDVDVPVGYAVYVVCDCSSNCLRCLSGSDTYKTTNGASAGIAPAASSESTRSQLDRPRPPAGREGGRKRQHREKCFAADRSRFLQMEMFSVK